MFCTAYLDDILIHSDSLAEHKLHVKQVLEKLEQAGIYLLLKARKVRIPRTGGQIPRADFNYGRHQSGSRKGRGNPGMGGSRQPQRRASLPGVREFLSSIHTGVFKDRGAGVTEGYNGRGEA